MYTEFYQLTERPFNVTPDPKFLYLNARYREAIASLNYGITQRKGFITLIGEAGTGKTTLLKRLLDDLDAKTKTVFIFNTNVTFEEILEYIFAEFDLPVHNGKKLYMLQRLNSFLLNELQSGGNVALLIDEAQDLEFSVLEDLRLLSNLETAKEKILQIVLSGQPELGQKLSNPILRQLRQRIGINCRLLPLSRDEISEYIRYRLQAAGSPDLKLFSRDAEDQIYHFSRGIPRLVNVVCDNALVIGYALGHKRIGADVINEAAADLLSVEASADEPAPAEAPAPASPTPTVPVGANRWRARFGVMSIVMAAIVLGLLSVGRTMLYKRAEEPTPAPAPALHFEVIRPGSQSRGSGFDLPTADSPAGNAARAGREAPAQPPSAPDAESGTQDEPAAPDVAELAQPPADEHEVAAETGGASPKSAAEPVVAPRAAARPEASAPAPPANELAALGTRPKPKREPAMDVGGGASPGTAEGSAAAVAANRFPDRPPPEADSPRRTAPLAAPAPAAPAADSAPPPSEHAPRLDGVRFAEKVVRPGDSVSQIALQKYGQATHTILDMLKLANPDLRDVDIISVGQTIKLPELGDGFPTLVEGTGRFALLVFSTPRIDQATNLQKALQEHGFRARVSEGKFGSQRQIYRVVLPGFSDRSQVAEAGRQLQKVLREDSRIAKLGE
jgi:general secretion pathway protein A